MYKPEFEELAYHQTLLGELILRRRTVPSLDNTEVFEIKLDNAFLMSSLNTETEAALATIALNQLGHGAYDVLIGGLGLGYTAKAALESANVRTVSVIEVLPQVIDWHRRGLVPLGKWLMNEPRLKVFHGDFFQWALSDQSPLQDVLLPQFGAILIDIDHSPEYLLHPVHRRFYEEAGLQKLATHLLPGGVFALWSADPPQASFVRKLEAVFDAVATHEVEFFDLLRTEMDANTIYLARYSTGS